MKIVFYISSLGHGGAERVISNLANFFSNDRNNNVYLIIERPVIRYHVNSNINLIELEKKERKYNFITKKTRYLSYIFKLKKQFKKIKPDVVVTFLPLPSFMALISRKKNTKVIVGVRNDPKKEYTTWLKKKMMNFLYPRADGFVFQTNEAKLYFNNIINCKQEVIYNAVSKDFINYKIAKNRKKQIVAVGRLCEQKNYPLLINAFNKI